MIKDSSIVNVALLAAGVLFVIVFAGLLPMSPYFTPIPSDFILVHERTQCLGRCPVYEMEIDSAGRVSFRGDRFVSVEGERVDVLSGSELRAIYEALLAAGLPDVADEECVVYPDMPWIKTTVRISGNSTFLCSYGIVPPPGGAESGLIRRLELEDRLHDVAVSRSWVAPY